MVRVNSTVSTVCASTGFGGLVDVDTGDDQVLGLELVGNGVGLGVLEELNHVFGRLKRPSTLSGLVSLSLGSSSDSTRKSSERNTLFVFCDVVQEREGFGEFEASDGSSCLPRVLEMDAEVVTSRPSDGLAVFFSVLLLWNEVCGGVLGGHLLESSSSSWVSAGAIVLRAWPGCAGGSMRSEERRVGKECQP